ncbi:hypothetical protein LEP1GSC074_1640 [Leptospira noguchii str. Hook]|uniref:Uncharacterized protein n=2 Tax=Leptospira noguchii TaxID=28182 RepID=M6Y663_9LEPT|nr:hypothetical protein LEP1GSC041_1388 [Leptospira noguchii str. 2006001870]EMI71691.1 hypothetical protein LEP1GSC072_2520 [Leptospira noguchii str. Bonito]EMO39920.1 hypothetical protein LEP1GSC186_1722 [Leptospira noguchii serovar Autumnalis str. ZUN142]EMO87451.1 hypothetical protein LEP1GSC024_1011 [Leptospira noguchii str. 2001034031]EMS82372.1 hypothetical protein LEP1GSC074_1640 [Leptospira noguchii str. Hook]EMS89804.1 hypothetical protein LEP1GSC073_2043 [Leptospira noguchii str. Ca
MFISDSDLSNDPHNQSKKTLLVFFSYNKLIYSIIFSIQCNITDSTTLLSFHLI